MQPQVHGTLNAKKLLKSLKPSSVCAGVVRGHKTEGQDLFYSVEKEGQRQWYNRTAVILSLEQGNKLREQHSLGPYEPTTPLTKASDISLGKMGFNTLLLRNHQLECMIKGELRYF